MGETWTTTDGRQIPFSGLEDAHIINIIKYVFSSNLVPVQSLFREAGNRGLLELISHDIRPREGYKSPTEVADENRQRRQSEGIDVPF